MANQGTIRTGIGGWTFEPWRGTFFPDGLKQKDELRFAAGELATIEVNGTYYSTQKPATFAKWASEVPDGFVFSLKATRYVTNRRVLAEAEESIAKFLGSGMTELGDHLGPLLWQFAPTKKFDPDDFGAFLQLLPDNLDGLPLRHALEVRNPTFACAEFISLARKHKCAIVYAHHNEYPEIADVTANFVYARLQRGSDDIETCYPEEALSDWAERVSVWAKGEQPDDLPLSDPNTKPKKRARDVFVYFIHEGKVNAPNGARALVAKLET